MAAPSIAQPSPGAARSPFPRSRAAAICVDGFCLAWVQPFSRISSAATPFRFPMIASLISRSSFARRFSSSVFSSTPELQVHQRRQSRRDPGVKLAGIHIGDQSGDGVSDRHGVVQVGQRIQADLNMTIPLPPNPAQFRRLIRIGVKETQSALSGGGAARLALLGQGLAGRIRGLRGHLLLAFVEGDERGGARIHPPVQGPLATV